MLPSFTAVVSVLGVSFGVAAFLVVVTVFNSFESQLRQILLAANPNLVIYKFPGGIPDAQAYMESLQPKISKPVARMSLFEYNDVILGKDDRTATVVMRGIEGESSANADDLGPATQPRGALASLNTTRAALGRPRNLANSSRFPNIILGKGLALKLGAKLGDEVNLTSASYGPAGESRYQKFHVSGLLSVGLAQYDEKLALIGFADGVDLFGKRGWAKGIEVRFKNPTDALAVSNELREKIPYTIRAWQEIDRGLFEQIERDGGAIKLIVLIITLVAGFNIIVTLSLSVVDRSKQIAVLRSLGAPRLFVVKIFVFMGLVLGVLGAAMGLLIGTVILKIFSNLEMGELQAFYWLEKVPVEYDASLMGAAFGVAIVLSFLSALYPAYKATLVSPLYGLKH